MCYASSEDRRKHSENKMQVDKIMKYEGSNGLENIMQIAHTHVRQPSNLIKTNLYFFFFLKITIVILCLGTTISQNNALHNHFYSAQIFTLY